jgi:hypothetical protein
MRSSLNTGLSIAAQLWLMCSLQSLELWRQIEGNCNYDECMRVRHVMQTKDYCN